MQLKRFLIVPGPTYFDTIALWSAHTYLLRNEAFGVGFTPLLAFQSPIKRCGKSTGLKCAHLMSYDARMVSSITPSSLFRVVDEYGVSLMVDEADNVFKDEKSDLLGIMNAGRDRMTARVMRAEAVGDGKFKVREFNTFAPIALTSIKQLPDTLQDRAIVLPLKRATQWRAAGAADAEDARTAHRHRPAAGALGGRSRKTLPRPEHAGGPVQPDRGQVVRPLSGRRAGRRRLARAVPQGGPGRSCAPGSE